MFNSGSNKKKVLAVAAISAVGTAAALLIAKRRKVAKAAAGVKSKLVKGEHKALSAFRTVAKKAKTAKRAGAKSR